MVHNGDADNGVRRLIERYLSEVDASLVGVPAAQRREILEDLRAHVEASLVAAGARDEATARTIIDRLGSPEELAREARERLGVPEPMPVVQAGPGLLEYAAIVLTALFWPVGILLAWLSPLWRKRDKVIATLIGCLGVVVLLSGFMAYRVASIASIGPVVSVSDGSGDAVQVYDVPAPSRVAPSSEQPVPTVETVRPTGQQIADHGSRVGVAILTLPLLFLSFGSPFLSALYLAIRLQRPPVAAPRAAPHLI